MKFETELKYVGMNLLVKGCISCADEVEIDSVSVWNGKEYVEAEIDVFEFYYSMEDCIRESIEQDAEAAAVAAAEDRWEESRLEGINYGRVKTD